MYIIITFVNVYTEIKSKIIVIQPYLGLYPVYFAAMQQLISVIYI